MYYYGQCRRRCPNRKTLSVWVIFVYQDIKCYMLKKLITFFNEIYYQ